MKILKILGIIIVIPFAAVAVFSLVSVVNHKSQLRKEAQEFYPAESVVEVNHKKIHVFLEGEGDLTLVFMAGHGTSSPVIDFKPLWSRMSDHYRIAVVERSGYGWSETSNTPRDLATVLAETRTALELSGENGPYVLIPHSMAGLEAVYRAQKYPGEVAAIIGLDPLTPEAFDVLPEPEKKQLYAMVLVSRIGLSRYIPDSDVEHYLPIMKSEELTEKDRQEYLAAFYRSAYSKDMLREVDYLQANAEKVAEKEVPASIPMYLFISEGQEETAKGWQAASLDFFSKIQHGKHRLLPAGHYVHYDQPEVIAEEAKAFLEEIK